jgi:hypothetical protein
MLVIYLQPDRISLSVPFNPQNAYNMQRAAKLVTATVVVIDILPSALDIGAVLSLRFGPGIKKW